MANRWMTTVEIPTQDGEPIVLQFGPATRDELGEQLAGTLPSYAVKSMHVFDGSPWLITHRAVLED